jgi:hypothetical protein
MFLTSLAIDGQYFPKLHYADPVRFLCRSNWIFMLFRLCLASLPLPIFLSQVSCVYTWIQQSVGIETEVSLFLENTVGKVRHCSGSIGIGLTRLPNCEACKNTFPWVPGTLRIETERTWQLLSHVIRQSHCQISEIIMPFIQGFLPCDLTRTANKWWNGGNNRTVLSYRRPKVQPEYFC